MVLGRIANSIFGTPSKDKAEAQQANIEFNQLSLGNQLHNRGTTGKMMQELGIRNYARNISEKVFRKTSLAQGAVFKTAERIARIGATKGFVATGGQARSAGRNTKLMLLSQLSKAQNLLRYTKGENASAVRNASLLKYQADASRANEMIGVGVGAKRGVTYTDDTAGNVMKLGKLAISAATGTPPIGIFGQTKSGENASLLESIFT